MLPDCLERARAVDSGSSGLWGRTAAAIKSGDLFLLVCVFVDARTVPGEPAAASALEAEALWPGARGVTGAPRGPQVPGQSGERVSVDEAAAGGGDGAVLTCYQLKHTETRGGCTSEG